MVTALKMVFAVTLCAFTVASSVCWTVRNDATTGTAVNSDCCLSRQAAIYEYMDQAQSGTTYRHFDDLYPIVTAQVS